MNSPKKAAISIGKMISSPVEHVLVQTMTSTATLDTLATLAQIIRAEKAGAQLIRISARNVQEAAHLAIIKKELHKQGCFIPLIADIHFNPKAAEVAAKIVEKVRINPGNYVDRNTGKTHWTKAENDLELQRIKARLAPLVEICKTHNTAIRVGVNYGSLSNRILHKYGNTAEGMAESAWEFIRIFQELAFHQLIISLKASHVLVMLEANFLFAKKAEEMGQYYPLHLGVTEAGDADDGRVKSALGMGTLLSYGIGNTIRVSLTEEPELEIPVAISIVQLAQKHKRNKPSFKMEYKKRRSHKVGLLGANQSPVVIGEQSAADYFSSLEQKLWHNSKGEIAFRETNMEAILNGEISDSRNYYLPISFNQWQEKWIKGLREYKNIVLVLVNEKLGSLDQMHQSLKDIRKAGLSHPIVYKFAGAQKDREQYLVEASILSGSFLLFAKLDGLWLQSPHFDTTAMAFSILQASRQRISHTEYIACPSCGRTLFNIQEKLQELKEKTKEFVGLKIAVMGCIVNGIGEMADADYGYVGAAKGKVDLYKGHKLIKKNVAEDLAATQLRRLILSDQIDV